jgi:hypothetical protein
VPPAGWTRRQIGSRCRCAGAGAPVRSASHADSEPYRRRGPRRRAIRPAGRPAGAAGRLPGVRGGAAAGRVRAVPDRHPRRPGADRGRAPAGGHRWRAGRGHGHLLRRRRPGGVRVAGRVGRVAGPRGGAGGAGPGDRAGAGQGLPGAGPGRWGARALPAHGRVHDRGGGDIRAARLPPGPRLRLRGHPPPGPGRRPARAHPGLPARPSPPPAADHRRRRAVREPGHRGTWGGPGRAPGGQRAPAGGRPVPASRRGGRRRARPPPSSPRPSRWSGAGWPCATAAASSGPTPGAARRPAGPGVRRHDPVHQPAPGRPGGAVRPAGPVARLAGFRALDPDHVNRQLPIVDLEPLPAELADRVTGLAGQHTRSA